MRAFAYRAAALLLVAVAGGCATRADLVKVQRDQREVRALLADTQVAVDGLRRRIDMLRSEIEEGNRRGGSRGSSVAMEDLQRRLAALEDRLATAPAAPETAPPAPPAGETSAAAVPPSAPEPTRPASPTDAALAKEMAALQGAKGDDDYREALQLVRGGQCEQAVPKFRAFLKKSPKSDLADNAQYWIGECYYGQRDYNKAILELNDVLLKYSSDKLPPAQRDKVPSALLTLASAFADSGDKMDARLILQKLISDHPKSEEAERGRQKLQALGD